MNRRAVDALMVTYYSPSHPRGNMFRKISLIWEIPVNTSEQERCVVDGALFNGTREPLLFGAPQPDYPNTTVRFFIGENEPSSYIIETANNYYDLIRSDTSIIQNIENTGHQVARTEEGLDALLASIRETAKETAGRE